MCGCDQGFALRDAMTSPGLRASMGEFQDVLLADDYRPYEVGTPGVLLKTLDSLKRHEIAGWWEHVVVDDLIILQRYVKLASDILAVMREDIIHVECVHSCLGHTTTTAAVSITVPATQAVSHADAFAVALPRGKRK